VKHTTSTLATLEHEAMLCRKTLIDPLLPKQKDISILDLGCGYGAFVFACEKAGYHHIVGVDNLPVNCGSMVGLPE